jgi:hypothetical protein
MSELIQEIEVRRANRALSEKKIPSEVVGRIMTAATYAPLCFNYQSWRFIVVLDEEFIVITLVAVGYPGDDAYLNEKHQQLEHSPRIRKPESEVICYNAWEFSASE